ncbi:Zn-dependent hydrolase [Streptomonospora alba]|uniref:Zn-dependent hydrolase n=1 Tax=Streptomonospora alba TaxID=183763 RepID=A0A0C2FMG3_9ACTN|nr:MBL fold metallo-hydrolase [Streptomonospora alba]KII00585.1 Zn-dependent hydrolase [Streptomonospora alba]
MFWKRKGKKKDGDEAEGSGAESAVTTTSTDTEDTGAGERASEEKSAAKKAGTPDGAEGVDDSDAAAEPEESDEDVPAAKKPDAAGAEDADPDGIEADEADEEDAAEDDEDTAPAAPAKKGAFADADEPETAGVTEPDEEGVQRVRTVGVLKAEDQEVDVVSNTWIVDVDDEGVVVIDPAHDAEAVMEAVGEREVYLVACTNGYNTHIAAAVEVAERDEAPIALHRREVRAWRRVHGAERRPDLEIEGGGSLKAGDIEIDILPIPGTSTGSVAYYISEKGVVFTGDSLRKDEVGTVAGGYIDFTQQLHSIGEMILTLPPDTRVLPDSGPETTVGEASENFDSWVATR